MPKSSFIDFKAVKAAINIEQVLDHYGLTGQFKRGRDSLSGPCPIHKGTNPTQFRVSISKSIWNCFSQCKSGGNVLDFIAKMEEISIHAAACKAIEWFDLDQDTLSPKVDSNNGNQAATPDQTTTRADSISAPVSPMADQNSSNKPLAFRLEKLERNHQYLIEREINLQTIVDFGVGYCSKGVMAGRIAIPIHNPEGKVVAYAGRIPGESGDDVPKYKLPQGFRKSLELFNIDRAIKEPRDHPLIIVEGFFDCMKLHQNGWRKTIALMGSTMSAAQEELIRKNITPADRIIVMLDEDEAGRSGRDDIALRLAQCAFVRVCIFEKEGMQPDQMSAEDMRVLIGDCR